MKRLTFAGNFCDIAMCDEVRGGSFCENGDCSQRKTWERLKAIEDILGDEYELDRLRELVEAEKEDRYIIMKEPRRAGVHRLTELAEADRAGRCVVLPCKPGHEISYKSGIGLRCSAVIDEYIPENIFVTAKTEIPNAEPLIQTFSISEVKAALKAREQE